MLTSFTRWFLLWFLATVVLLCLGLGIRVAAATEKAGAAPPVQRSSSHAAQAFETPDDFRVTAVLSPL
jgi:hypothetical protein